MGKNYREIRFFWGGDISKSGGVGILNKLP